MPVITKEAIRQISWVPLSAGAIKRNLLVDKLVQSKAERQAWVNIQDILHIAGLSPPFSPRWKEKGASP